MGKCKVVRNEKRGRERRHMWEEEKKAEGSEESWELGGRREACE